MLHPLMFLQTPVTFEKLLAVGALRGLKICVLCCYMPSQVLLCHGFITVLALDGIRPACNRQVYFLGPNHQYFGLELIPWTILECSLRLIWLAKTLLHRSQLRATGASCFLSMCLARLRLCIQTGQCGHWTFDSPGKRM